MIGRREFVVLLPALIASCTSVPARKRLRVLVLGGTNFVGPHLVQTSLDRGHIVTMFNRGKTNPGFFPEVEKLRGDRYADRGDGLSALRGDRTWDIVFDTWAQEPGVVRDTAILLRDRVPLYAYVSSVAVYGRFVKIGLSEEDPTVSTARITDPMDPKIPYPTAKRAAEEFVIREHGRALIGRATSINGFDRTGNPQNQQSYWPLRLLHGGEVLAPGDGDDPFQYIDVKDYASFLVSSAERGLAGIYNVVSPPIAFSDYLSTLQRVAATDARLTQVATSFLLRAGVRPFEDLPAWIPTSDPEPGFFQISNDKARAAGLTFRPLTETVRDVLQSFRSKDLAPNVAGGLSLEREREVLEKWKERAARRLPLPVA